MPVTRPPLVVGGAVMLLAVALARPTIQAPSASPATSADVAHATTTVPDHRSSEALEAAHELHRSAVAASDEGRLDDARALHLRALELQDRLGDYASAADSLACLGRLALRQGRLDDAERHLERALARAPGARSEQWAGIANSLAIVARDTGDAARARRLWESSLEIFRELDPKSAAVAGVLNNLGTLALRLGDLDRAEARYGESLALRRELVPGSRWVASSLHNLGMAAQRRGDHDRALALMVEALEVKRRLAPGTRTVANSLLGLGETSYEAGRLADAERYARDALTLRERIAPGSLRCAQNRVLLGKILVAAGRFDEGEAVWRDGLAAIDRAHDALDASAQRRSVFVTRFQDHFRDLVAAYVRERRVDDAFALVEHSRARALRGFTRRDGRAPLDLDAARAALDGGTRLVIFSVSRDESLVLVVGSDGAMAEPLAVGRAELGRRVEIFRALIERGRLHPEVEDALVARARDLYDLLLAPIADRLEPARRLVVVPDGPLATLPFAALLRSDGRWVAEHAPLSYAVSATVFAHAKARRPASGPVRLTVVARSTDGDQRWPGIASEATRIARRAAGRSRLLLDGSAREAALVAALQAPGEGGIVHVATHATVDDREPLASALHLAPGSGEDGVLAAHEILDEMAVTSDLVVLAACSSGRGRALGGEGVLGLSHALLFAGARSLVTSLWPVVDSSTAGWMTAFYDQLDRGVERDEALQRAQRRGIVAGEHPVHWAAFQLWGDWGARRDLGPVSLRAESSGAGIPAPLRR